MSDTPTPQAVAAPAGPPAAPAAWTPLADPGWHHDPRVTGFRYIIDYLRDPDPECTDPVIGLVVREVASGDVLREFPYAEYGLDTTEARPCSRAAAEYRDALERGTAAD